MIQDKLNICRLQLRIPSAESVAALGELNNWSTVSNLLIKIGTDLWELRLPTEIDPHALCFFVWDMGARGGHVVNFSECEATWHTVDVERA